MNIITPTWDLETPAQTLPDYQAEYQAMYNEQVWPYDELSSEQFTIASRIVDNYLKLKDSESRSYNTTLDNWMLLSMNQNPIIGWVLGKMLHPVWGKSLNEWVTKCTLESKNWVLKFYIKIDPKEWPQNSYKLFINDHATPNAKEVADKVLKRIDDHLSWIVIHKASEEQQTQNEKNDSIWRLIGDL